MIKLLKNFLGNFQKKDKNKMSIFSFWDRKLYRKNTSFPSKAFCCHCKKSIVGMTATFFLMFSKIKYLGIFIFPYNKDNGKK